MEIEYCHDRISDCVTSITRFMKLVDRKIVPISFSYSPYNTVTSIWNDEPYDKRRGGLGLSF